MVGVTDTAKKSLFYDFLARYGGTDFETYMASSEPDEDYLNWNGYTLAYVFTDEQEEYDAVRHGCALFDATPANKYRITGDGAGALLDHMTTRAMSRLPEMRATYAIWCNPDGMLNDDAMLFKRAHDDYLLMAAEVEHLDYLTELTATFLGATVVDESADWAGLAVQGAKSCAVLNAFGFSGVEQLKPYDIGYFDLGGEQVMVARVGFTGDLGYEIWFARGLAPAIEAAFLAAEQALGLRIAGYGLTTIQLCRMESGMIVPGWDTAQTFEDPEFERSPLELGLAWNVDLERDDDFVGKAALLAERANGSRFALKGFEIDDECELLDGAELFATVDGEDVQVGTLPSVSWSHDPARWIGLASLRTEHADIKDCFVVIDDEQHACRIVGLPFVQIARRREVPAPL
jgi:aminomethyltransferase